ncbi:hypothetical protein CEXT_177301 [Caerostris extrusa]|uniref:Uncharacterized protein n=1 Tax=Caerostris extrusa TaxID=172846 RepID=A0AAV4MRG0_CAEEX|nr:hypothetical protein CEXT_177301 [Caerostris extrusa]
MVIEAQPCSDSILDVQQFAYPAFFARGLSAPNLEKQTGTLKLPSMEYFVVEAGFIPAFIEGDSSLVKYLLVESKVVFQKYFVVCRRHIRFLQ